MNFEKKAYEYILQLKNSGVLIDANIYGVNEELMTAEGIGRFLVEDGSVQEKHIILFMIGGVITWRYLIKIEDKNEMN